MKANLISILLVLLTFSLSAQGDARSKLSIGLLVSVDQTQMQYELTDWVAEGSSAIQSLDAKAKLGYSFGLALDWKINQLSAFRITPLFSRQYNQLEFVDENSFKQTFSIQPYSIGTPIHYIFSPRGEERQPYFFVGPRIHFGFGEEIDPTLFSIGSINVSGEFGVGIKLSPKNFSISPQLSFNQGFTNLKSVGESGLYNNAISAMSQNRLSLSVVISR